MPAPPQKFTSMAQVLRTGRTGFQTANAILGSSTEGEIFNLHSTFVLTRYVIVHSFCSLISSICNRLCPTLWPAIGYPFHPTAPNKCTQYEKIRGSIVHQPPLRTSLSINLPKSPTRLRLE